MKKKAKKIKRKGFLKKGLIAIGIALVLYGMRGKSDGYLRARSVMLLSAEGQCSGEQIHTFYGNDYILSAGHRNALIVAGSVEVITESGEHMKRKVIAEDPNSDLLLVEGIPNLRGLDIAKSDYARQHVRTFTHGRGMATYETDGILVEDAKLDIPLREISTAAEESSCKAAKNKIILDYFSGGKVCLLSVEETITTAAIVPGSSGGMVVDDSGNLIGVCSAGNPPFGSLVRLKDIQAFVNKY